MVNPHEIIHKNHMKIMKELGIKNYKEVYYEYIRDGPELLDFINNRIINKNDIQQHGGSKPLKIKYIFEDNEFILFEKKIKDGYDIAVYKKNDPEKIPPCLHIIINTDKNIAYIQNISYHKECISTGLDWPGGGSTLLKMSIQLLKDTKKRYKVNKIQLKDNSYFYCKSNHKRIHLPIMFTLIYGTTWYGKYGFRPYDPIENTEDTHLGELFDENKKIVLTTKIKDTKLFDYLFEIGKKSISDENELKKRIKDYYKEKKDLTINEFFKKYMTDFNDSCEVFYLFYQKFYTNQKLYDFTGRSFYLDI